MNVADQPPSPLPQPRKFKYHVVKSWPMWFDLVWRDDKKYEVRKDDRDYKVGDVLIMLEWDPDTQLYTGREIRAEISHKVGDNCEGIMTGYCVLGLTSIEQVSG